MKHIIVILTAVMLLFTRGVAAGESPLPEQPASVINTTNLNTLLVEALQEGKAIYGISKSTIAEAVTFAMEQTPLVITEILRWKFVESLMYALIWASVSILLLALASHLRKYYDGLTDSERSCDDGGSIFGKWICRIIATVILIVCIGYNAISMAKVVFAPRLVLIEMATGHR